MAGRQGWTEDDVATFEAHRPALLSLAYRMLGDLGRAEDIVQDAWLRWQGRKAEVGAPKAYLVTTVTRLCLNELESARARREEIRGDRLPEPVDLQRSHLAAIEATDDVSMAFLVALQRLTPAERAVLLLHDVFDFNHAEIGALVNRTEAACRQLLRRAREHVATEREAMESSHDEHWRLLRGFLGAVRSGDVDGLSKLLADDALVISDGGADGVTVGRVRNLPRPLPGAAKIAAFLASSAQRGGPIETHECLLNGQPALIASQGGRPFGAVLLQVVDDRIRRVFIHADPARLGHLPAI
jgi:RNA polymerase sigma-70 factor (ECF subfamily)